RPSRRLLEHDPRVGDSLQLALDVSQFRFFSVPNSENPTNMTPVLPLKLQRSIETGRRDDKIVSPLDNVLSIERGRDSPADFRTQVCRYPFVGIHKYFEDAPALFTAKNQVDQERAGGFHYRLDHRPEPGTDAFCALS
ncbi:MAG TPA: hypothetical protein VIH68_00405, partial [Bacteroidota bacterium]